MTASTTPLAQRHLRAALAALCRDGMLADRLDRAQRELASIDPSRDLPEATRFRFEELMADIAYGAETVPAALARMSAPDREQLSARILSLFADAAGLPAANP